MKGPRVRCAPNQDVFAFGALFVRAVSNPQVQRPNVFASPVGDVMVSRDIGSRPPGNELGGRGRVYPFRAPTPLPTLTPSNVPPPQTKGASSAKGVKSGLREVGQG